MLLFSSSKNPIKEDGVNEIQKFEGAFRNMSQSFQGLSGEIKDKLCTLFFEVSEKHRCSMCEKILDEEFPEWLAATATAACRLL